MKNSGIWKVNTTILILEIDRCPRITQIIPIPFAISKYAILFLLIFPLCPSITCFLLFPHLKNRKSLYYHINGHRIMQEENPASSLEIEMFQYGLTKRTEICIVKDKKIKR